jgi:predicted RNA-binding Zn ribbon-like protein
MEADMQADDARQKWTSELARSIAQVIIERSPTTGAGRAAVDTWACLVALKHVAALLIASQPPEEWKQLCEDFGGTLLSYVTKAAAADNPTYPLCDPHGSVRH